MFPFFHHLPPFKRTSTLFQYFLVLRNSRPEVFLKTSQNSEKKTQPSACNFIKKRFWQRCFPVNFAKFLRTSLLQYTSGRLYLSLFKNTKRSMSKRFLGQTWAQWVLRNTSGIQIIWFSLFWIPSTLFDIK